MRSCSASKTTKARESNKEMSECPYMLGRREEADGELCLDSRDNNIAFSDAIGNGEEEGGRCDYSVLVGDMWAVLCFARGGIGLLVSTCPRSIVEGT